MSKSIYEQVAFEDWKGANGLGRELFILNFRLHGMELKPLRLDRVRRSTFGEDPRFFSSVWTPIKPSGEFRLLIDIYESRNRLEAQEKVVDLLSGNQLPTEDLRVTKIVGDQAFIRGEAGDVVFCRANLTVSVAGIGAGNVSPLELARQIDGLLTSIEVNEKPKQGLKSTSERKILTSQEGERVLIGHVDELSLSLPESPWYKFSVKSGRCFIESGNLFCVSETTGKQTLTVASMRPC